MKKRGLTRVFGLSLAALLAACGSSRRVATPADMQQLGTKSYPSHSRDEVVQASITGLKLLGYEVVTSDPHVRTAPKLVNVSATASYARYSGSAQTYAESVAWDLDVKPDGQGATVHAEPHASVNGQPMEAVYYTWAQTNYGQLFKAIDDGFGTKPAN